jgi:hypothetical protein
MQQQTRGRQAQTSGNPYLQVVAKAPPRPKQSLSYASFAINYRNRSTPAILHDLVQMVGYQAKSLLK